MEKLLKGYCFTCRVCHAVCSGAKSSDRISYLMSFNYFIMNDS